MTKRMEKEFYLRPEGALSANYLWLWWLMIAIYAVVIICFRAWVLWFTLILPVCFGIFAEISGKLTKDNGLYIKGNRVYIKGAFSEKDILLQEIAGIKIMRMYHRNIGSATVGRMHDLDYYADGRPIYLIFLLSEISQDMYNYKDNNCYFTDNFKESILYIAEFNPGAVKYLKTLNPDIKVFY